MKFINVDPGLKIFDDLIELTDVLTQEQKSHLLAYLYGMKAMEDIRNAIKNKNSA